MASPTHEHLRLGSIFSIELNNGNFVNIEGLNVCRRFCPAFRFVIVRITSDEDRRPQTERGCFIGVRVFIGRFRCYRKVRGIHGCDKVLEYAFFAAATAIDRV